MAALMQVKATDKIDHRTRYFISAAQLSELTGNPSKNNYRELKKAADALLHTVVEVTHKPNGEALEFREKLNLTSGCQYVDAHGVIGLRFNEDIIPYISELKERFTQYQARYVMPMRSGYGIRLYELCLQWLGDEREFHVDEFRTLFQLHEKYASNYEIKRNVINPALHDINTFSNIRVRFEQRKTGRRVTHFIFSITRPAKKTKLLSHREWIGKNRKARAGESWDEVLQRTKGAYQEYRRSDEVKDTEFK